MWVGSFLSVPENKQFAESVHLAAQDETYTHFSDLAFEQRLVILVIEQGNITCGAFVQTVFNGRVVNKTLTCIFYVAVGGDFSSDDNADAVTPETFGKLERIVGA